MAEIFISYASENRERALDSLRHSARADGRFGGTEKFRSANPSIK